jgi:RNase adaptor protein for sRNA GlmZ degradation
VAIAVVALVSGLGEADRIVVDAVRTSAQVTAVKNIVRARVVHAHLSASGDVLAGRYDERRSDGTDQLSYADARRNETESKVDDLAKSADLLIDTGAIPKADVIRRVAAAAGV